LIRGERDGTRVEGTQGARHGASRGIDRACVEVLAEEGCDVVLVSGTAADIEAPKAKIISQ
jgi:short-subunit dehydrogenase